MLRGKQTPKKAIQIDDEDDDEDDDDSDDEAEIDANGINDTKKRDKNQCIFKFKQICILQSPTVR